MKKIVTIVGARPQFVKAAALSRKIQNDYSDKITEVIVHTGQHYDANMSDIFFTEMDIPKPDYNLDINGLSHGAMTGQMLEKIEEVLVKEQPDLVLVYGDTNSTIAGALAASKMQIKVGHVEAGLRSFNMAMPEEVNRILTDRISTVLFCPTQTAIDNLEKEGYKNIDIKIVMSGDIMLDSALYYAKVSESKSSVIKDLELNGKEFILGTIHRQENTDDIERLTAIINGLNVISKTTEVVVPIHPRTRGIIDKANLTPEFTIIDPVGYFDMIELLKNCDKVVTDSGGLQKEAFFFKKPCITMRDETEWVELIEAGVNVLVGANEDAIIEAVSSPTSENAGFDKLLYGNGDCAGMICEELLK